MAYSASDWCEKIAELVQIYLSEPVVEARHLSQHRHFILTGTVSPPFVSVHAVYLGLRGQEMRERQGRTQNIQKITQSLLRHGYHHVDKSSFKFGACWERYLLECDRVGRVPSGGRRLLPEDRSFFAPENTDWLMPPKASSEELAHFADFQRQISHAQKDGPKKRQERLQRQVAKPKAVLRSVMAYVRNPDVVAEHLSLAKGICEECNDPAPFISRKTGRPFLEVHHVIPLADHGEDAVENTRALCPNCHRKAHYG